MSRVVGNLARALTVLVAMPVAMLFAYDVVAVRPHLDRLEAVLAAADPEDAAPPELVRELIDAGTGEPAVQVARLVMPLVHPDLRSGWRHLHGLLLSRLLPLHLDDSQMYGLYCALSYNGTDQGLNAFARREFGKPLSALSPMQAATTVAILRAPKWYLRDRDQLDRRARQLLEARGGRP